MKKLLCLLILWGSLGITAGYGQDQYANDQKIKFVPTSPNAASLGIFGSIPVGHYTGVPNISIPLYEIKSGDLTLPISLAYHASGIKVAQEASSVGLGWALMAGGCITRSVKQGDDFGNRNGSYGTGTPQGYYWDNKAPYGDENNNYINDPNIESVNNIDNLKRYLSEKDSQPDIFSFNFGTYSGSCFFERNGVNGNTPEQAKPIIVNKKDYLDIKFFPNKNYWIIYDALGNKYKFDAVETTVTKSDEVTDFYIPGGRFNNDLLKQYPLNKVTTAWFLSSIESPKGDKIELVYGHEEIYSRTFYSEDCSFMLEGTSYHGGHSNSSPVKLKGRYAYYHTSRSRIGQLHLREVRFGQGKILFDYNTPREDVESFYPEKQAMKLDRIMVMDNGNSQPVRVIDFAQSYFSSSSGSYDGLRLKLDRVTVNDGEYVFGYNNGSLPNKTSDETDYWGYYTTREMVYSRDSYEMAPPCLVFYETTTWPKSVLIGGRTKRANKDLSQFGVLNSIVYPTGGRTTFEYELHNFSHGGEDYNPKSKSYRPINDGAGLRIRRISDSSENGTSTRIFTYTRQVFNPSGILMTAPMMHQAFVFGDEKYIFPPSPFFVVGYSVAWASYANGFSESYRPLASSATGAYVGYSRVEEEIVGVGSTVYYFKNEPDKVAFDQYYDFQLKNFPTIPNLRNGQTDSIVYYNLEKKAVKRQDFTYNLKSRSSIKGLVVYAPPMAYHLSELKKYRLKFYDLFYERHELTRTTDTEYFPDGGKIVSTTEYKYDPVNLLKNYEKTTIGSDVYEKNITYSYSTINGMKDKHMVGYPTEITQKKNGKVISASKTTYANFNNGMYLPKSYSAWDTVAGKYYVETTINQYDANGNLLQLTSQDNVPTTYLWSYNNQLPVAEIKNATYQRVVNSLGSSTVSSIGNSTSPNLAPVNSLRGTLPNTSITTYTHKPLVGVTSTTDPSGRKIEYGYDSFGRLQSVIDDNGNPVQNFDYHYKKSN
jgi:YD repeat-containing protein